MRVSTNLEDSADEELGHSTRNETSDIIITETSGLLKQKLSPKSVGAMQVDEQAPQLNRRYYLGLDCPSVTAQLREERACRCRRTQGSDADDQGRFY